MVMSWADVITGNRVDNCKVREITESMSRNGWQGRPLLVVKYPEGGYLAVTGSHRIAAARQAGIEPDILLINATYDEVMAASDEHYEDIADVLTDEERVIFDADIEAPGYHA